MFVTFLQFFNCDSKMVKEINDKDRLKLSVYGYSLLVGRPLFDNCMVKK